MRKNAIKLVIILLALIIPVFSYVISLNSRILPVDSLQGENKHRVIVIDAGHGGIDGGATSYTGTLESHINLEIARRLDDFLHLLGMYTQMIRTSDISIYNSGTTIAAKKVSDLKERVRIIHEIDGAILISIHQNYYPESQYYGAQVFYGQSTDSKHLASELQNAFINTINPQSTRQIKEATGIYLMENIQCTGVLIECGFISNPNEAHKLETSEYQIQLCCVIGTTLSRNMKALYLT